MGEETLPTLGVNAALDDDLDKNKTVVKLKQVSADLRPRTIVEERFDAAGAVLPCSCSIHGSF